MNSQSSFLASIQSEICKQLCAYYEKLDENYTKFTRILNAESKFIQLAATNSDSSSIRTHSSNQHGHIYFRVGIFGSALKISSVSNRYYLYKHHSYEMLSNIQTLIQSKLSYAANSQVFSLNSVVLEADLTKINQIFLLHHNQLPDANVQMNMNECYLQVCAVNKLECFKLLDLVDEMIESKETIEIKTQLARYDSNAYCFYYDRPFYMLPIDVANRGNDELNESVENLWLERSLLIVDEDTVKYENLMQFEEIVTIFKILLNPIRNAINDINEKTKELKNFIVKFTTDNSQLGSISSANIMHNLQPLTMRLLGCLDARVNGGLIKYVKELLNQRLISSKQFTKKTYLLNQLYHSMKEQLEILESGLSIHNRILKNVQLNENSFDNNSENFKHMNQLNEHLIECLKLIELELSERWSKYSSFNIN